MAVATAHFAIDGTPSLAADGTLTLARGAGLSAAVEALALAIDGVVVADTAAGDKTLKQPLMNATVAEALRTIATDFDRHWIRRGRTIALRLRRSDPTEPSGLEIEEIRLAVRDFDAILRQIQITPAENRRVQRAEFCASLTPQQVRQMAPPGGLAFTSLTPDQRTALISINRSQAYGNVKDTFDNAFPLLDRIQDCTVTADNHAPPAPPGIPRAPESSRLLRLRASVAGQSRGELAISLGNASRSGEPGRPRPSTTIRDGTIMPAFPATSAPILRRPVRKLTLAQFATEWHAAMTTPLRIPAYAAHREFVICSVGAARVEGAQALADLWGWELSSIPGGRRLGRRPVSTVRSMSQLDEAIRGTIPPAGWYGAEVSVGRGDTRRWVRELLPAYTRLARSPGVGKESRMSTLSSEERRSLANAAFEAAIGSWAGAQLAGITPNTARPYLLEPNKLVLEGGPPHPTRPGTITVRVPGARFYSGWSWPAYTTPDGGVTRVRPPPR